MAEFSYWDVFASRGMVQVVESIASSAAATKDLVLKAALVSLISDLRRDLYDLARAISPRVDAHIRRFLESERKRPPTDKTRHLSDNIHSRAPRGLGALGVVGVAEEAELDRTTNPDGGSDRPYWLVIEEGSVAIQPEMRGRRLFGSFVGPGGESAPSPDHFREDSSFIFGTGLGRGVVQNDIEPQHFLERGTEEGWSDYVSAINALQSVYVKRLLEIQRAAAERASGLILPRR